MKREMFNLLEYNKEVYPFYVEHQEVSHEEIIEMFHNENLLCYGKDYKGDYVFVYDEPEAHWKTTSLSYTKSLDESIPNILVYLYGYTPESGLVFMSSPQRNVLQYKVTTEKPHKEFIKIVKNTNPNASDTLFTKLEDNSFMGCILSSEPLLLFMENKN